MTNDPHQTQGARAAKSKHPPSGLPVVSPQAGGIAVCSTSDSPCCALVANMPLYASMVDREGVIRYFNRASPGLDLGQIIGTSIYDYISPEFHEVARAAVARAFAGEGGTYECRAGDGGHVAWYETHVGPMVIDGWIQLVSLVSQDTTARKQAAAELAQTKALLESVVENIPYDFWVLGTDGRYVLQNAVSREHWRDAVGKTPAEVCNDPATLARWLDNNRRAMAGERVDEEIDLVVDGQRRRINNVIAPIRVGSETIGILGFNFDVTDQRHAEAALRQAQDDLELRVKQRTADFCEANAKLLREIEERKRAEETLRQSHEELEKERHTLRHLLEAGDHERRLIAYDIHDGLAQQIAGAMLQFQAFARQREQEPGLAEKAFTAGLTMLEQSHLEARRLISGVRPPILDESGVVAAIAHLVNDHTFERGPRIEFRSRVRFGRLNAVLENAVYRIVQEGLVNACRHSRSDRVRISLVQRGLNVSIEIRDWGVGFDPAHVGQQCYGLEGIRERARVLGGRSNVQSRTDRGSRILVELPLLK